MTTKPRFRLNSNGIKSSSDMYRNINGVHYSHFSACGKYDIYIEQFKQEGLKYKIIKGELFVESHINH